MKRTLLTLAVLLLAVVADAQKISWIHYDPAAVRSDRTEPATIELVTSGSVAGVRLDLTAGGSITLTPAGPDRWRGTVTAPQLLFGYDDADVNHNAVGVIRLLGADGATLLSFFSEIDVVDSRVPMTPIREIDAGARATVRLLNLFRPAIGPGDVSKAVQQFYDYFPDDFDFVQVVFVLPSYVANRYHVTIRNDVQGIGIPIRNLSASYGSAGRLKGLNVFPNYTFFDPGETAFCHELGHQWINYLATPLLSGASPHWPPSTMARGVMGFNIPGTSVGGQFPYRIEMIDSTTARVTQDVETQEYSDFDLYLMGFIPPSWVAPGIVIEGSYCVDCTRPAAPVTIADVIAANGSRVPDWRSSQKSFRIGTVVISRDRLLNDEELAVLEYFAARGEATEVLPFTSGSARGTTKPFYVATRGIGRVNFRLEPLPPRRRAVSH